MPHYLGKRNRPTCKADWGGVELSTRRAMRTPGDLATVVFESEVADRAMIGQATEADAWKYVDEMIISAAEGVAKPERCLYQIAVGRLGVRPEKAVFVDDLVENVQGAQAFGMWSV